MNQEFRWDLTWWQKLFQTRDGLSFFCMPMWAPVPDFQVSLNAVGSLGNGTIFNAWSFCCAWAMEQRSLLIRCLSITLDHLQAIQQGLDFDRRDHVMLWAACRLGFFGFLQVREIMVNFSLVSMTVDDLQTDSLVNPTCFKVHIKSSKTDLFCMGCEAVIYMWGVVCPIHNLGDFLALHGSSAGPLFTLIVMEALLHSNSCLPQFSLSCTQLVILAPI
ncbi:unnamed protein product [Porites lobata]|uniref:Uncharacterized protein n=1 Tax=Porites lobata TaxID=104759 RepID=A0ABN8NXM1_9CNID|nr:unnamed protein product [Porites lobata]